MSHSRSADWVLVVGIAAILIVLQGCGDDELDLALQPSLSESHCANGTAGHVRLPQLPIDDTIDISDVCAHDAMEEGTVMSCNWIDLICVSAEEMEWFEKHTSLEWGEDNCTSVVSYGFNGTGLTEWPPGGKPDFIWKEDYDVDGGLELAKNMLANWVRDKFLKKTGLNKVVKVIKFWRWGHRVWLYWFPNMTEKVAWEKLEKARADARQARWDIAAQLRDGCLNKVGEMKLVQSSSDPTAERLEVAALRTRMSHLQKGFITDRIGSVLPTEATMSVSLMFGASCLLGLVALRRARQQHRHVELCRMELQTKDDDEDIEDEDNEDIE